MIDNAEDLATKAQDNKAGLKRQYVNIPIGDEEYGFRISGIGAKSVKLFGEEIAVNAEIATLHGTSGHADQEGLLNWLKGFRKKPQTVFVNHGDDMVCDSFAQTIMNKLQIRATAPFSGDEFDLITGECTAHGKIVKVAKISDGRRRANQAFDRLMSAAKRLMNVIEFSRGLSNKEMAKFTDQVNSLCDKYIRKSDKK